MNKGHIYFEIQADDTKRAIDFYSQVFGWKFSLVPGLPILYWTIETGGSRGGLSAATRQDAPATIGHECFCLLAGGREFRRNSANHPETGRNRGASQVRGTGYLLAGLLRRPRRKHLRNFSSRSKSRQLGSWAAMTCRGGPA